MTYLINENAPTRCCNTGEGNDKNPWEEPVMTTLATHRKPAWHPAWCWQERCDQTDPSYTFHMSHPRIIQAELGDNALNIWTDLTVPHDGGSITGTIAADGRDFTPTEAREYAAHLLLAAAEAERAVVSAVHHLDKEAAR